MGGSVDRTGFDPYKNFKFRVKWDGRSAAGFSEMRGLKVATEVGKHGERGDASGSRTSPGHSDYEAITLERGVTHDTEFATWANKTWSPTSRATSEVARGDFRTNVVVEVYDEAGQLADVYRFIRCWVSEFQTLPDLDANANAVAIQHLKLENEGWERDDEPF
jgi:phage tail-like protein